MDSFVIIIVVFLALTLGLVVAVFVVNARRKVFSLKDIKYVRGHWNTVLSTFALNPAQAILDADKILDYALRKSGFEGTLGEKLKKAGPRFSDLNGVWTAHKLRNRVAHELTNLDSAEAKRALGHFKRALNDLGVKF